MNDLKAILSLNIEINIDDLLNGVITISSEFPLSLSVLNLLSNTTILYDINFMDKLRLSNKDPCNRTI